MMVIIRLVQEFALRRELEAGGGDLPYHLRLVHPMDLRNVLVRHSGPALVVEDEEDSAWLQRRIDRAVEGRRVDTAVFGDFHVMVVLRDPGDVERLGEF